MHFRLTYILFSVLLSQIMGSTQENSTNSEYNGIIKSNKLVVFARKGCPFGVKAKALLDKHGLSHIFKIVNANEVAKKLFPKVQTNSFPVIFYNGTLLDGGFSGLIQRERKAEAPFNTLQNSKSVANNGVPIQRARLLY